MMLDQTFIARWGVLTLIVFALIAGDDKDMAILELTLAGAISLFFMTVFEIWN